MKIYAFENAPNCQRLQLFTQYKGLDIETVQIDMMAKEQLGEEYRSINPLGTVPALVTDEGALLTEVVAQMHLLEGIYPDKPLLGRNNLERAQVINQMHLMFNMAFGAAAEAFRNSTPGFKGRALPGPVDLEQIPELAERGIVRLAAAWDTLNEQLQRRDWLVGDGLTQADIDLLVCQGFAGWIKQAPGENHPNLLAHKERVQQALAS